MRDLALALRQWRYENKSFWRNPPAAFFTFVFPLLFLAVFNLVFGDEQDFSRGVEASTFYAPAIIAFSVISACYTNIGITVSIARDSGVLKRIRGAPLPSWAWLFGRLSHAVFLGFVMAVIVGAVGYWAYDVDLPGRTLPAAVVTVAVGAAVFSALGIAVTALVPNVEAAPAVVNATLLPILFVSDIFIPLDDAPSWLGRFADVFPIRHFSEAMLRTFHPATTGSGFSPGDLLVMGAWGVLGIALAARFFSWEPRR